MTAPTQPITVKLADFGGPAVAGITITARLSEVDYTADGIFVSTAAVTGVTDANGEAVLDLFPNALVANGGLGTVGTSIRFTAQIPNSQPLDVEGVFPNQPCLLTDYVVSNETSGLSGSQQAATDAQAARDLAKNWATKTDGEVVAGQGYGARKYAQDVAASVDAFAFLYPGSYATAPTTRPPEGTGAAIQAGDRANFDDGYEYHYTGSAWVSDAKNASTDASTASTAAAAASDSANVAAASEGNALTYSNTATAASATSGAYPNGAASNVPKGLSQASVGAITAGSGGTNGTFALTWSGGNFLTNPSGTFTVSGGAVTAVTITGPGLYIGSSPTIPTPSFAASTGLTGAAVALTTQFLVTSGQGYWVTSADGLSLDRYRNVSGVATADTSTASLPTKPLVDTARMDLDYGAPKISPGYAFTGNIFNGAVWVDGSTAASGIKIPVGVSGRQSFYNAPFTFTKARAKALTGKTVRFFVWFEISSGALSARTWAINKLVQQQTGSAGVLGTITNEKFVALADGTRALLSWDITFGGDEANVQCSIQTTLSSTATVESTVKPISQHYALAKNGDSFQDALDNSTRTDVVYFKTITVKPDGTGDYTTLKAAFAAEGGGVSLNQRILYKVYEGVYTDISHATPSFIKVLGIGKRENVWFKGEQAASETLANITANSTFDCNETAEFRNIKATAKNMRYVFHSDGGGSVSYKALQEIYDCDVEHYGNDEAVAYQTSIGGSPGGVWTQPQAWGCGTHSGERILSKRTRWAATVDTFGFHTNKDFTDPCYVELDQCQVINTKGANALACNNYGTGTPDRFVVKGCEIQGKFASLNGSWLTTSLYNHRGNRTSEIGVYITDSSPVAWTSTNNGTVLELRSIDAATSSVAVSGTGADALFGTQPVTVDGGSGYPGRVWSSHSTNGMAGTSLGSRLGDCTTVNKTLNITFDGSINVTLTLDQNYSAMTNAQVVTALNTLLADGTRLFSDLNPYNERATVYQPDRETRLKNNSSVVILKGMAVAYDTSNMLGRAATSADARALIAGIALDNIAPGKFGRIQRSGYIHQNSVLFNGAVSLAFGDTFGVSSTAGKLVEAAAVPLLRYVNTSVFEVISP